MPQHGYDPSLRDLDTTFDVSFGNKRALQSVVAMTSKFSQSRIRFILMRGQAFELLAVRNNWGGDRVS